MEWYQQQHFHQRLLSVVYGLNRYSKSSSPALEVRNKKGDGVANAIKWETQIQIGNGFGSPPLGQGVGMAGEAEKASFTLTYLSPYRPRFNCRLQGTIVASAAGKIAFGHGFLWTRTGLASNELVSLDTPQMLPHPVLGNRRGSRNFCPAPPNRQLTPQQARRFERTKPAGNCRVLSVS